jgi:serine/threonine-protein kinase
MEFVNGATLEAIMKIARKQKFFIPIHHAIFIIMQTLEGLYYAHNRKDSDGKPLNVVHRDISPPNIIMTLDGHAKITDFGLAKATTQLEKTNPNSLKGKIDYMSPEQAKGEELDGRTDIFATAIILYEMLTNKKLFSNKTTLETLKIVQEGKVAPISTVNSRINKELERIIAKALAPNPDNRYQTALAFQDDLAKYIFKYNLKVITHDISESLLKAFTMKRAQDKKKNRDTIDELIMNALIRIDSIGEKSAQSIIKKKDILGDIAAPLNIFSEQDEKKTDPGKDDKKKKRKKWGLF